MNRSALETHSEPTSVAVVSKRHETDIDSKILPNEIIHINDVAQWVDVQELPLFFNELRMQLRQAIEKNEFESAADIAKQLFEIQTQHYLRLDEAILSGLYALQLRPENQELRLQLAQWLESIRENEAAIQLLNSYVESLPVHKISQGLIKLGDVYLRQNNIEHARDCFQRVLAKDAKNQDALLRVSVMHELASASMTHIHTNHMYMSAVRELKQNGDIATASEWLARAFEVCPSDEATTETWVQELENQNRAMVADFILLEHAWALRQPIESIRSIHQKRRQKAHVYNDSLLVWAAALDETLSVLAHTAPEDPVRHDTWQELDPILNTFLKEVPVHNEAELSFVNPSALAQLRAHVLQLTHNDAASTLLQLTPTALFRTTQSKAHTETLVAFAAIRPEQEKAWKEAFRTTHIAHAEAEVRKGHIHKAMQILKDVDGAYAAHLRLAMAQSVGGPFEFAIALSRLALTNPNTQATAFAIAARAAFLCGEFAQAKSWAEQAVQLDPENVRASFELSELVALAPQEVSNSNACHALEQVLQKIGLRSRWARTFAVLSHRNGDNNLAVVWARRAWALRPGCIDSARSWLQLSLASGNNESILEAICQLTQCVPLHILEAELATAIQKLKPTETTNKAIERLRFLGASNSELICNAVLENKNLETQSTIAFLETAFASQTLLRTRKLLCFERMRRYVRNHFYAYAINSVVDLYTEGQLSLEEHKQVQNALVNLGSFSKNAGIQLAIAQINAYVAYLEFQSSTAVLHENEVLEHAIQKLSSAWQHLGVVVWRFTYNATLASRILIQSVCILGEKGVEQLRSILKSTSYVGTLHEILSTYVHHPSRYECTHPLPEKIFDDRMHTFTVSAWHCILNQAKTPDEFTHCAEEAIKTSSHVHSFLPALEDYAIQHHYEEKLFYLYEQCAQHAFDKHDEYTIRSHAARILNECGRYEDAAIHAHKALALTTEKTSALETLTCCAHKLGKPELILNGLLDAIEQTNSVQSKIIWLEHALQIATENKYDLNEQCELALKLFITDPNDSTARIFTTRILKLCEHEQSDCEAWAFRLKRAYKNVEPMLASPQRSQVGAEIVVALSRIESVETALNLLLQITQKSTYYDFGPLYDAANTIALTYPTEARNWVRARTDNHAFYAYIYYATSDFNASLQSMLTFVNTQTYFDANEYTSSLTKDLALLEQLTQHCSQPNWLAETWFNIGQKIYTINIRPCEFLFALEHSAQAIQLLQLMWSNREQLHDSVRSQILPLARKVLNAASLHQHLISMLVEAWLSEPSESLWSEIDALATSTSLHTIVFQVLEKALSKATREQKITRLYQMASIVETRLHDEATAIRYWFALFEEQPNHAEALRALERLLPKCGSLKERIEFLSLRISQWPKGHANRIRAAHEIVRILEEFPNKRTEVLDQIFDLLARNREDTELQRIVEPCVHFKPVPHTSPPPSLPRSKATLSEFRRSPNTFSNLTINSDQNSVSRIHNPQHFQHAQSQTMANKESIYPTHPSQNLPSEQLTKHPRLTITEMAAISQTLQPLEPVAPALLANIPSDPEALLRIAYDAQMPLYKRAYSLKALAAYEHTHGQIDSAIRYFSAALELGDIHAGDEAALLLSQQLEREPDLLLIRRRQSLLQPGVRERLNQLHAAALGTRDFIFARAVDHTRRAFDPAAGPVPPPPLDLQLDRPDLVVPLIERRANPIAKEVLRIVWEYAPMLFRRELTSYGLTGAEKIQPTIQTALGKLVSATQRLLGTGRTPIYVRTKSSQNIELALTSTPAIILSSDYRDDNLETKYLLGVGFLATLPSYCLLLAQDEGHARTTWQAILAAFGPPQDERTMDPQVRNLAASLWQSIPPAYQRRLNDLLKEQTPSFDVAINSARQVARRAGLYVSGDLATSVYATLAETSEPSVSSNPMDVEDLADLCSENSYVADLVRFATSPEFAEARWRTTPTRKRNSGSMSIPQQR